MRIRQSFGRQESADSKRPLIHGTEDTDASTLSLISHKTTDQSNETQSSSNNSISRNSSDVSTSKLSRPMAVIHINDSDPTDGRPKRLPNTLQTQLNRASSLVERKLSAPLLNVISGLVESKVIENTINKVSNAINKDSNAINKDLNKDSISDEIEQIDQNSRKRSRRTVSLKNASVLEERRPPTQLKHTLSSESQSNSIRPVRKTASQRQSSRSAGYGSKFTRAFTRKSGFNLIFDEAASNNPESEESDIEAALQRFEQLYRKVHRKLKRKARQSQEEGEQEEGTSASDPEMNPDNEGDKKCKESFMGRRIGKWIFWSIVSFLAALTIKDVIELVQEYTENPKQTDINVLFNNSMTMPNITFCMGKHQAYSHFNLTLDANWDRIIQESLTTLSDRDSFLNNQWDYRMTVEGYEVISSLSSMERETESIHGTVHAISKFRELPRLESKRKMIKKWIKVIKDRDVSFEEFTQKVGIETIRPSMQRFQRLTFDDDVTIMTKFHTSWISETQFCYQPTSTDPKYMEVDDQGRFFTLSLSHNGTNLDNRTVNCMTLDFHGRPSSLNRFMEGKGRTRDGFDDEICMGQYHEIVVEVRALYEMLENDDNGTICRQQKDGADNEFDCKSRCRMEMLRELCQCTPLTLSYLMKDPSVELKEYPLCDYTRCILDVQNRDYTDLKCQSNCHRDCKQIRYTVNHKIQGRLLRSDMTVVELQFGSFEYLKMEQSFVWSVATFVAALGGSIGIWLGLSILSLIQGGTYVYSYLTDNVIKTKIKQRRASLASPSTKNNNPMDNPFTSSNRTTSIQIE